MSDIESIIQDIVETAVSDACLPDEDRVVDMIRDELSCHSSEIDGDSVYQALSPWMESLLRGSDCSDGNPFRAALLHVVGTGLGLDMPDDPDALANATRGEEDLGLLSGGARGGRRPSPVGCSTGTWGRVVADAGTMTAPLVMQPPGFDRVPWLRLDPDPDVWPSAVKRGAEAHLGLAPGQMLAPAYHRWLGASWARRIALAFCPIPMVWDATALWSDGLRTMSPVELDQATRTDPGWTSAKPWGEGDPRTLVGVLGLRRWLRNSDGPPFAVPGVAVPTYNGPHPPSAASMPEIGIGWTRQARHDAIGLLCPQRDDRPWIQGYARQLDRVIAALQGIVLPSPRGSVGRAWPGTLDGLPGNEWADDTDGPDPAPLIPHIGRAAAAGASTDPTVRVDWIQARVNDRGLLTVPWASRSREGTRIEELAPHQIQVITP